MASRQLKSPSLTAKNHVFVVSGKEIVAVCEFFGDIVGLGLGAEHGFYYRWPQIEGKHSPVLTGINSLLLPPSGKSQLHNGSKRDALLPIKTYLTVSKTIDKNMDTWFRFLLLWNFVLSFIVAHVQLYFFK